MFGERSTASGFTESLKFQNASTLPLLAAASPAVLGPSRKLTAIAACSMGAKLGNGAGCCKVQ